MNSYFDTGVRGTGYTVPLSHPKFKEQIEDGIWDAVITLISKGYETVTSCEGHWWNDGPQVTIKGRLEFETFFIKAIDNNTIDGDYTSIRCKFRFIPNFLQRILLKRGVSKIESVY